MSDYYPDYDDETAEARARDDDDDQAWLALVEQESAPDCPFCGHPVDVVEGVYICGNCIVSWDDIDKLERERDTLAAQGWAQ